MTRHPAIHHCTSQPLHFFGRSGELTLLDDALAGGSASVVAFVGPGGQGKTAIVQHWLRSRAEIGAADGCFLWSFYRGKDSDLCLRQLFAYAEGLPGPPDVSASFCVDRLIGALRRERWAIVLDGAEVVQHESGAWRGRFIHPELGRLIETLAEEPMPGVLALTTRFELPTLSTRRHARTVLLNTLDDDSGVSLLKHLGVRGTEGDLLNAVRAAGGHAKAVELLGTWLTRFHAGAATAQERLPPLPEGEMSDEERHVLRILDAHHASLAADDKDLVALATHFHQPPTEKTLVAYLRSEPVARLLFGDWGRSYRPWKDRSTAEVEDSVQSAIDLRLLERVSVSLDPESESFVLDAHPLVRRGFEHVLGAASHGATARAGFLRGRPDRAKPSSLAEAREEVELFHALCAAEMWTEADNVFRRLDNPKHRFLAPAFERDLLLRFFPDGDWRQPPLWSGFGRWRSLAICCEMLGQFDDALALYRPDDAALGGDALIALGRLDVLLAKPPAPHPWQSLWSAYRGHALVLAGRNEEALRHAQSAWPVDVYEWVHHFETLLRLGRLDLFDPRSFEAALRNADDSQWTSLARRRILADYRRVTGDFEGLASEYRELVDAYDRAGLPVERVLVRLSQARLMHGDESKSTATAAREIAVRHQMPVYTGDAEHILGGRLVAGSPRA